MKFKKPIEVQAGIEDSAASAGTAGQLLSSLGPVAGVDGVEWVDQSTIVAAAATLVEIECKNTSGSTITKGTPVYQTGNVGATAVIEIAEADALISANQGPAIGLLQDTLINNAVGFVVIIGELLNFTTSPIDGVVPTVGDKIFVKSGGGLTTVKPTTSLNSIQAIGLVGKVSGGNSGSVTVSSTMRANDVPNLPEGRIWIGDGNTIVSDTVYVDDANGRVGIGTASPQGAIQIGDGTLASPSTNQILVLSNTASTGGSSNLYLATGASGTAVLGMGSTQYAVVNTAGKITYTDSSDTFSFNTNFSTKMVINGSGNVGIGTTSPNYKLEVSGTLGVNRTDGIIFAGSAAAGLGNKITSDTSNNFIFSTSLPSIPYTTSTRMTILNNGNVGIGTTSTNYKLDVYGNLKVGTTGAFTISQSQFGTTQFYVAGGGNGGTVIFGVPASYQQNVSVQGDLYTASGSTSSYLGTKRFGSFNNRLDPDGDNYLNSGNLGIGTTSPSARLEVQGTNSNTQAAFKVTDSGDSFFEVVPDNSTTFKIGDLDAVGDEAMIVGTFSDITFSKGGTTTMILDSNNRVGIGTTAPLEKLQVNGNAAIYGAIKGYTGSSSNQYLSILQSSNLTYISTGTTNETIYFGIGPVANVTNINVAGTATATNFILSSDKTLKDKIKDIKTNHVDIKWKNFELISEPGVKRSGVIAQELEVKHPEFVRTDKDGLKSVAYIDLLITKIAELEARLEKAGL